MKTCDSTVGGASVQDAVAFQVFPDSVEHPPKLCGNLPSIVVEPTEGGQVESGELCWPPDDVNNDVTEGHNQETGEGVPVEEVEPEQHVMGRVHYS
ncbi:protein LBH-like [Mastacembelus armatus]|nr:protein LBH-like [Mastacembelus armatus]